MTNTVKISLSPIIADFFECINRKKPGSFSALLYGYASKIPDEFQYKEPVNRNKRKLSYPVGGTLSPKCRYFIPQVKQNEFENMMKFIFDELFFLFLDVSKEYTDEQYNVLIEYFCLKYELDYCSYFGLLKKKHYRKRIELTKTHKKS